MENAGKRIIFLDVDGTLTEPGSNIPPISAQKAIQTARERGHYVFLCTGRNYEMLKPLLLYGFDGMIASAGGYVECRGELIYDCPMTEKQKRTALEVLKRNGVFYTVECKDGSYVDEGFKLFLRENIENGRNRELLAWREQVERSLNILPMSQYNGQPVYKIVTMSAAQSQLEEPVRVLEGDFALCIQNRNQYGFINAEFVNRSFDKGRAVKRVCAYLGIPVEKSIAIGDSMNDREMLLAAGRGICMANGSEEIKKLADEVCPSVTEDGIWHAFQKHHLVSEGSCTPSEKL